MAPKKICVSACGSILSPSLILIWSRQSCVHLCTLFAASCILYAADVVYSAELQLVNYDIMNFLQKQQ